jgi:hypothetical protein
MIAKIIPETSIPFRVKPVFGINKKLPLLNAVLM